MFIAVIPTDSQICENFPGQYVYVQFNCCCNSRTAWLLCSRKEKASEDFLASISILAPLADLIGRIKLNYHEVLYQ